MTIPVYLESMWNNLTYFSTFINIIKQRLSASWFGCYWHNPFQKRSDIFLGNISKCRRVSKLKPIKKNDCFDNNIQFVLTHFDKKNDSIILSPKIFQGVYISITDHAVGPIYHILSRIN